MKKLLFYGLSLLLLIGCRDENKAKSFEQMADRIATTYVSDRRTDRFELEHRGGFKGLYLTGYTTVAAAYDSLQGALASGFVVARNDFRLLPDAERLEGRTAGIVNVSVANLRSEPGHSRELATQALLGTPLEVLDERDGWYLVRTPDRYLAWLEGGAFVRLRPEQARERVAAKHYRVVAKEAEIERTPGSGELLSEVTAGALLRAIGRTEGNAVSVALPDGQEGWIEATAVEPATADFYAPDSLTAETLLRTAFTLQGRPYLWGGTSPKGMDCSGFTKTAYYLNGLVIPRDASQQVHAGEAVTLTADLENLRAGDLLFFGNYRTDGSERITHVGFYLGEGRFLHAGADNGRIRVQSLLPEAEDYVDHRRKSLLRARRLRAGSAGVVPVGEAFSALLSR